MVQITRQDVADIVNGYLRDRLDARVSYGSDSYPSDFADPNYSGPVGGRPAAYVAGLLPGGAINAASISATISAYVRNWGRVRTTQFLSYYNTRGALSIRQNVTAVTRLTTSVATVRNQASLGGNTNGGGGWSVGGWVDPWLNGIDTPVASPPVANTNATRSGVIDYCNRVFNKIVALDSSNVLRITKQFCHSNCYTAPHGNRGRR